MKNQNIAKILAMACFPLLLTASATYAQTPRQQAWSILQSGATNSSSDQRVAAVTVLALIPGDTKAVSVAEQALQDQDPSVRIAAANTLGALKAKNAIPKLRNALTDKDGGVVMAVAKALVAMGSEDGYGVYYAIVTGERKSGASLIGGEEQELEHIMHNPRDMAEMAFEQGIGYVPFGGQGFAAFEAIHKSEAKETLVKATAVKLLAKDPDPRSGKALVNATSDTHWLIRAATYDAIARRGDSSLLPDVTKGLSDQHDVAKLTAAAAVAQLSTLPKK